MSFVAVGVGGAALVGGIAGAVISSNASSSAADKQQSSANYATDVQKQQYDQTRQDQQPWRQAGAGALTQMQDPSFQKNFSASDFQQDPGYQFDLQQGQQALERSAAARGGLQSGGTMKGLAQYTQGMASNEYQNAYNRFQQNKTTNFNQLASIAGLGQTANGQLGQAGENMASNVGGIAMSNANAQGAASIARGNVWGGAINGGINAGANTWQTQSIMNRYAPQQPMGGGGYGSTSGVNSDSFQMPEMGSQFGSSGPSLSSLGSL